jgi:hypothetical protein
MGLTSEDTMNTDKGSTQTKPTPGALRAADKILEPIEGKLSKEVKDLRPLTLEVLARVIDRETAAPDLLAALRNALRAFESMYDDLEQGADGDKVFHEESYWPVLKIKSAIAKAEGTKSKAKGESL